MVPGTKSVNRHHLVPKLKGGKEAFDIHIICHSKIHSLWSETELAQVYNNWESIVADDEMKKFIKWVARKPPGFKSSNRRVKGHSKSRRK